MSDEVETKQERYEQFLGLLPQFASDRRQKTHLSVADPRIPGKQIFVDRRLQKVESINVTRGWRASSPDLCFLQNAVLKLTKLGKMDPFSLHDMTALVSWAVQRVIRCTLVKESEIEVYVRFWTKDDFGHYEHGFPVIVNTEAQD